MAQGKGGGGQNKKSLTEDQMIQVETLAAYLSMEQIADYFGMSKVTLYRIAKDVPEVHERYKRGKAKVVGSIAQSLITKARKGDNACMMFYLKTQAGWRETNRLDISSEDGSMTPRSIDPSNMSTAWLQELLDKANDSDDNSD